MDGDVAVHREPVNDLLESCRSLDAKRGDAHLFRRVSSHVLNNEAIRMAISAGCPIGLAALVMLTVAPKVEAQDSSKVADTATSVLAQPNGAFFAISVADV